MPERRQITIAAHWTVFLLLMLLISGATSAVLHWGFGIAGLIMAVTALTSGLMNGPGPKLEGFFRSLHPWAHRAMYVLLAWIAGVTIFAQLFGTSSWLPVKTWHLILTGAAMFHAIFHLWRHTTLGDGALRRMTPQALHKML